MMKAILFCNLPYAFSILKPLADALKQRGFNYLWYVPKDLIKQFSYHDMPHSSDIKVLEKFQSDMIFVPGNDVPWYLPGVKVQVFHGLAGEKKGHFRIRDYFDLYLTQGPYFTDRFQALANKHQNFKVHETGWCKLDTLFGHTQEIEDKKKQLLAQSQADKIILYAPTFSPSLTSAPALFETIRTLSQKEQTLILIKFHDKMDPTIIEQYQKIQTPQCIISDTSDITALLQMADIMISDTSSVVYEFLLLDKPVITLNSHSENILWEDVQTATELEDKVLLTLKEDTFQAKRAEVIALYHPYHDGKSSQRMIDAILAYLQIHSHSKKRTIPLHRKIKMMKKYGLLRW